MIWFSLIQESSLIIISVNNVFLHTDSSVSFSFINCNNETDNIICVVYSKCVCLCYEQYVSKQSVSVKRSKS